MKIVMNKKEFIEKKREGVKANSWILQSPRELIKKIAAVSFWRFNDITIYNLNKQGSRFKKD